MHVYLCMYMVVKVHPNMHAHTHQNHSVYVDYIVYIYFLRAQSTLDPTLHPQKFATQSTLGATLYVQARTRIPLRVHIHIQYCNIILFLFAPGGWRFHLSLWEI